MNEYKLNYSDTSETLPARSKNQVVPINLDLNTTSCPAVSFLSEQVGRAKQTWRHEVPKMALREFHFRYYDGV